METIIQLQKSEYDELVNKAKMNESKIQKEALEIYKKRGVLGINVDINLKDSDGYFNNSGLIKFSHYTSINEWADRDYKLKSYCVLSYKESKKLIMFINNKLDEMFDSRFGEHMEDINNIRKLDNQIKTSHYRFMAITVTGWLAAIILMLVALLK